MARISSVNAFQLPLAGILVICASAAATPYESTAFALRQQVMINDLRTHCRISQGVSDEKIRSTFLADPENHRAIIKASDALRDGDRKRYAGALSEIRCPSML